MTQELSNSTALRWIGKIGVLAALYFSLGRLALLIAIPPGYATAVWPAAGVALAAILLYGYRLWPGVLIGSFVVNVTTALDSTDSAEILSSLGLPTAIAVGAVLQALLGAFLIRRFVGFPNDFDRVAKIIGTMALGGPLACLVNATVGVASLFLTGAIEVADLAGSWGTWWLGDTIGVMLVIPLAAAWGVERHQTRRRTRVLVMLPILVAITITALGYLDTRHREIDRAQVEFERRTEIMARALEQSVVSKVDIVESIVNFFGAVPETRISRAQFQAFVEPIFARHRDLHGLSWNALVPGNDGSVIKTQDQGNHAEIQITELNAEGKLVPARKRDEHVVVLYIEPLAGNQEALGFDLSSDPARATALAKARDTGQTIATAPIVLVQEAARKPGFLLFAPIYSKDRPDSDSDSRRQNIHSFVSGVFRAEPLFHEALRAFQGEGIDLRVMDTSDPEKASMLYTNWPQTDETIGRLPALEWSTNLEIAGRRWTVQFRPSSRYESAAQWDKVWVVLTGGLLFSSLFGAFLLAIAGRTTVIERANAALQREIDERLRAQAALSATEAKILETQKLESLGVLAGGIAHDFNNLLAGVLGNADLALTDLPQSSPIREYLRDIKTSAQRAADLANQLLAYSGKGRFVVEPTGLSELVNEISHLVEVSVSKKITLKYDLASGLPPFEADATQIRQLVLNVITNAAEAIGDSSGVVSITTGEMECDSSYLADSIAADSLTTGLYLFLQVSDTGSGMDQETRSKIFDPFFTTKFTGRGLGLAAALGIVRGHRGAIRIHSEPEMGTTVKVLFPASERPAPAKAVEPTLDEGWKGDGIALLVDDELAVLQVTKRMLEAMGLATLSASNGAEALQIFEQRADEIAVVLLDLTMPRMDGEETFRKIRRINKDVKVILSSGYSEQDIVSKFSGEGPVGFIQKPYELAALRDIIRRALEN